MSGAASLEADIEIDASPDQVWSVVSDLARMGEWSPECRKVVVFGAARKGDRDQGHYELSSVMGHAGAPTGGRPRSCGDARLLA